MELLDIPRSMLPEVKSSSEIYGYTDERTYGGAKIPIAGMAGDQQNYKGIWRQSREYGFLR